MNIAEAPNDKTLRTVPTIAATTNDSTAAERLGELADSLASEGVSPNEVGLRQTARWARAAGVSTVLVDLLVDSTAPEIARMRAFGKVAAVLATPAPAQPTRRVA